MTRDSLESAAPERTPRSSLAPELVLRILELSRDHDKTSPRTSNPRRDYPNLRNYSLVARSWTAPAQLLLSRYMVLRTEREARGWLEQQAQHPTRTEELWLFPHPSIDSTVLRAVVDACVELQCLALSSEVTAANELLSCSSLAGLEELRISNPSVTTGGIQPRFHLSSLSLTSAKIDPTLILPLFATSAHTLQTLVLPLSWEVEPFVDALVEHFPLVASSLRHFRVQEGYARLDPLLKSCTLRSLIIDTSTRPSEAHSMLSALPTSLHTVRVEELGRGYRQLCWMYDAIVECLDCPSLRGLKRFETVEDEWPASRTFSLDPQWEVALLAKGVEVVKLPFIPARRN